MAIFSHSDCDADSVEILAEEGDPQEDLILHARHRKGAWMVDVRLDRDAELRLYNALGAHLWPGETNSASIDPEPIYTALVRRLVTEEVARVLPLHQSPQATVAACTGRPECGCFTHTQERAYAGLCVREGCDRNVLGQTHHAEHDPEPHDVGHPARPFSAPVHLTTEANCDVADCIDRHLSQEPATVADWSDRLWHGEETCNGFAKPGVLLTDVHAACGHLWAVHAVREAKPKPRLMAEVKPVKGILAGGISCGECSHLWSGHDDDADGCCGKVGNDWCECTRSAP